MKKLGLLVRWDVGDRASKKMTWDGFVKQGVRSGTSGRELFFSSDDVETDVNALKVAVPLTYREKWSVEWGTWVATNLKQTGAGPRPATSWGDEGEQVHQLGGDAWFTRASDDSAGKVSVWAIGMKDRALKLPKLWDAKGADGKLDRKVILEALHKNSATWKYASEAADADNQHVLDCLDFHDPGPWAREGLHTGHHWKNLTNVVEHEEFPAMFYKILEILASKEKLLIVTVCKKGTHRRVAVLVVIELLCNFLRRRVTTYEASKESLEVRGHTCSYDKRTKVPTSCK